jgi:hypothetical protein
VALRDLRIDKFGSFDCKDSAACFRSWRDDNLWDPHDTLAQISSPDGNFRGALSLRWILEADLHFLGCVCSDSAGVRQGDQFAAFVPFMLRTNGRT